MGKARHLSDLVDDNGDVKVGNLDHAPNPVSVSDTAPSSPTDGDLWMDTAGGRLMKVWSGTDWDTLSNKFLASGGTITTYANYKVHTFTSSGIFNVSGASGAVDVLMVGGGASGGGRHGGGGGAGGVLHITGATLTPGAYTVTIGAGAAGVTNSTRGNNGGSTTFIGETAYGGGAGGSYNSLNGYTGGSGGGGGYASAGLGGGAKQPNPVNYNGTGYANVGLITQAGNAGGPGGGAGDIGNTTRAGNGIQINIDGNNYYWGGGGGSGAWQSDGGDGGLGGGGGGNTAGGGTPGTGGGSAINSGSSGVAHTNDGVASQGGHGGANTGGGSGSSGQSEHENWRGWSGNGGSGIVIVRYAV